MNQNEQENDSRAEAYVPTWVTEQLAVGHAPMSYAQLEALKRHGINAVLNLCGEFCDLCDIQKDYGFDVYHLPLADEQAPDLEELEKALAWLDEAVYLGKKVLIHCRHGIGRTGTVLNSYLLRRGLGGKIAAKKLKKIRSKPANFDQWQAVRKYGKQTGRLTIREPSLEFARTVDLAPFLADYEALIQRVETIMQEQDAKERCGREHERCCRNPVSLQLIEAVYLGHKMNTALTGEERNDIIRRGVEAAKKEKETGADYIGVDEEWCLSDAGTICPLTRAGRCNLFDYRPMQCRTFDLPGEVRENLFTETVVPVLDKISNEVYFAFAGAFPPERLQFRLADTVSGRYVQDLFHYLMKSAAFKESTGNK